MSVTAKVLRATEIVTPEFRVSYPFLFDPRMPKQGDSNKKPKFSVQMLFRVVADPAKPHEKVVSLEAMKAAAVAAAIEKWGADKARWPQFTHPLFRKGDETGKLATQEGYGAGVRFCAASSDYKPGIIDQACNDVLERSLIYPGCYGRAKVEAFGWEYMGKSGVSFGLRHFQLVRDGEVLGSRTRPQDDFDPIALPAAAATTAEGAKPATTQMGKTAGPNKDPFGGLD